jgi:hypothetical protein
MHLPVHQVSGMVGATQLAAPPDNHSKLSVLGRASYLHANVRPTATILRAKVILRQISADCTQQYVQISTWTAAIGFICTVAHLNVIEAQRRVLSSATLTGHKPDR